MSRYFHTEKACKDYILKNSDEVFGEKMRWVSMNFPGETGRIKPDLVGYDANDNLVIVEVKRFDPKPSNANAYARPREAIGQVIHYAVAYVQDQSADDPRFLSTDRFREILKNVRLFIVGESYSQSVEKMCYFLEAYGIDITYLSLDNI